MMGPALCNLKQVIGTQWFLPCLLQEEALHVNFQQSLDPIQVAADGHSHHLNLAIRTVNCLR